jgi:hypothetical protein
MQRDMRVDDRSSREAKPGSLRSLRSPRLAHGHGGSATRGQGSSATRGQSCSVRGSLESGPSAVLAVSAVSPWTGMQRDVQSEQRDVAPMQRDMNGNDLCALGGLRG